MDHSIKDVVIVGRSPASYYNITTMSVNFAAPKMFS